MAPTLYRTTFRQLNGLSMHDMVEALDKIKKNGLLDELFQYDKEMEAASVNSERIKVAMYAVRYKGVGGLAFQLAFDNVLKRLEEGAEDELLAYVDLKYLARKKLKEKLREANGFKALTAEEKDQLLQYIDSDIGDIRSSEDIQQMYKQLDVKLPGYEFSATFDPKLDINKPSTFRKLLSRQTNQAGTVSVDAGFFNSRRQPYVTTGPDEVKKFKFKSKKADALKYEVEIDKQKIAVYVAKDQKAANGLFHSIDDVAKGLAALPVHSRAVVKKVFIEPAQNPDDAYWAKEYKSKNFRSYMTAGAKGTVNIYPASSALSQDELDISMVHETGHTLALSKWGESHSGPKWAPWKKAMKKDGLAASSYAKKSPTEDFSETLALYEKVKGTYKEDQLRTLMPERMKILDAQFLKKP
ncbi:hypothetical protein GXP67_29570 [Rhodocytophaga rosea]|uniref:Uncharacterized protein n=1 Tax=Rhodocytophaga rosea TaxID=2704465 RepID=A0A6C0GR15_9BACT|nr:hypothetical protein [Rhodocytophaga rosea]QHT70506.1 hypothetical protein GXP67_29570 [Rhodocytophaga rosea]